MERSEPALVPEWLRSAGSVTAGGSSTHHSALSSSHSDVPSSARRARNRSSRHRSDVESPCSSFLNRSSSSNSWRNSSNGSVEHAYSSFTRHHDKDRDRDRDRLSYLDPWDRDSSDPLDSILTNREKDGFRRSQSMVPRKQGELLPGKDLKNGGNNGNNRNGILSVPSSIGSGMHKAVFDKDFPSLGSEDRQGVTDTSRVSSPGLVSAVQSLPVGNSALIGGEGWTSALVEVANVGSSSTGSLPPPKTGGPVQTASGAAGPTPGLNMAEALVQAPSRAHTPPQLSVKTQRLEELAVKQSRQLIPVTPSLPKGSVCGSSDKLKTKTAARTGETSLAASRLVLQQPPSFPHDSQSLSGEQIKADSSKSSQGGKLYVLKHSWENGVYPSLKDVASPTNNASGGASSNNQLTFPPSATAPATRTSKNPRDSLNMIPGLNLGKRPSLSQTKSRNDFFKLIKQKSSANMSANSCSAVEKHEVSKEVLGVPETLAYDVVNNANTEGSQRFSCVEAKNLSFESAWRPNDEERAFLRSLGWEENYGEDEGLTKEEIDAFYNKYVKLKPTLKVCHGFLPMLPETQETYVDGASSGSSSSSSEL